MPPLPGQRYRRPFTQNIINDIVRAVDGLAPGSVVYQGLCKGADLIARSRALSRGLTVVDFAPDWKRYGTRAGLVRNTEMAQSDAEMVFAFSVAESTGTLHCVREFLRMGKGVVLHDYDEEGTFIGLRSVADL